MAGRIGIFFLHKFRQNIFMFAARTPLFGTRTDLVVLHVRKCRPHAAMCTTHASISTLHLPGCTPHITTRTPQYVICRPQIATCGVHRSLCGPHIKRCNRNNAPACKIGACRRLTSASVYRLFGDFLINIAAIRTMRTSLFGQMKIRKHFFTSSRGLITRSRPPRMRKDFS